MFFKNLKNAIDSRVQDTSAQYTAFGIFGIFNYPTYYLIWLYLSPQTYESLLLRLTATFLCFFLVLHKYWPAKLQDYLPIYWYITLLFCLPFFFTYMLVQNHGANMWVTNFILIIFFLMFLVDWLSCLILLLIGGVLGLATAYFVSEHIWFFKDFDYVGFFVTYFVSVLIGAIFSHNKQILERQKLQLIESVGASIAHELRTPLRSIGSTASGIENYLPQLIEAYQKAQASGVDIPYIPPPHYKSLYTAFKNIESEVKSSFNFVNMLLINVNPKKIKAQKESICSIASCIDKALDRYPFDLGEKEIVQWVNNEDFPFKGNEELMIHVVFNLLKNALHYVKAAGHGQGEITIWLEKDSRKNKLHFKDTGTGISPKIIRFIFNRFFSKTTHGTGIGLTFCKLVMQEFGGSITCYSEEGKFTEFVLDFPNIEA